MRTLCLAQLFCLGLLFTRRHCVRSGGSLGRRLQQPFLRTRKEAMPLLGDMRRKLQPWRPRSLHAIKKPENGGLEDATIAAPALPDERIVLPLQVASESASPAYSGPVYDRGFGDSRSAAERKALRFCSKKAVSCRDYRFWVREVAYTLFIQIRP